MTQEYIGTKQVTAWEQNSPVKVLICQNTCHKGTDSCNGYCVGDNDHPPAAPVVPGYAIKYPDGYVSWSPKAVFEEAYLPIGLVGHLPPHQQRVIGEKAQLDDKLSKLLVALSGPLKGKVGAEEYQRLCDQADAMRDYSKILGERVEAF